MLAVATSRSRIENPSTATDATLEMHGIGSSRSQSEAGNWRMFRSAESATSRTDHQLPSGWRIAIYGKVAHSAT